MTAVDVLPTDDAGEVRIAAAGDCVQVETVDMDGDRTVVTMTLEQAETLRSMLDRAVHAARRSAS